MLEIGRHVLEIGRYVLEIGRYVLEIGRHVLEIGTRFVGCNSNVFFPLSHSKTDFFKRFSANSESKFRSLS